MSALYRTALSTTILLVLGCGSSSVRRPVQGPEPAASAFETVPNAPPEPHVDLVRAAPSKDAVWVDGQWERVDGAWRWAEGAWARPPPGAKFSPARLRRDKEGAIRFAAAHWVDVSGRALEVTTVRAEAP